MKRTVRGFTLVELLVVMAIISILAAIAVPNIINYIRQGRATKARADITAIEGGLVKMLTDSGRSSLMQLFNANVVNQNLQRDSNGFLTAAGFLQAQSIYTNALYALLRDGRGAATLSEPIPGTGVPYNQALNQNVCKKLGSSYVDLGFDPWGNLYNIYPGPWASSNGLVPFRKRFSEGSVSSNGVALPGKSDRPDFLTFTIDDPESSDVPPSQLTLSYPAARDKVAFIWSNGENIVSGQALYSSAGYDPQNVLDYYDIGANLEPNLVGGGDDVNNWDNASTWSSFY